MCEIFFEKTNSPPSWLGCLVILNLQYGQDAVLPMEVVVPSLRVSRQNNLNPQEYNEAMMMELEVLDRKILQALDHIMI